ncbi:MAG TPA: EI24 domain-containing protein [Paracoccaceae bacterium]|nr:EI24 domain-containing protein [Paracoccaceae bacterium]
MGLLGDILRALRQVGDRRFLWVLAKALALTVALLVGLTWVAAWLASGIPTDLGEWWLVGQVSLPEIGPESLAIGFVLVASVFLMIPVAALFVGFFLEEVAEAVEARHYPGLPPASPPGLMANLGNAARFAGVVVAANLLALVLYLMAGPLAPFVFYAVNGYLLGREYFELVAARHMGFRDAVAFRRRHWARAWAAGTLMAVPLTIPVMNLFVPVLGVAAVTHQFHRLWRPGRQP